MASSSGLHVPSCLAVGKWPDFLEIKFLISEMGAVKTSPSQSADVLMQL